MKPWELEEIRRAVKAKWSHKPSGAMQFNGKIATDSRKAQSGELFIAIAGARHDAHDFLADVIDRGVAAIIAHKEPSPEILARAQAKDVAILLVDNTIAALNRLAAAYRAGGPGGGMRAKVIAVGGSNGKTTTKFIIHTLLSQKFNGHVSPKSFNNNIGMPLTLLEVEAAHDFVVLEIGTNHPGEMAALGEVCRPDIAVITSIGLEHLEFFSDLDGVAREEAAIAAALADGGTLILPSDAPQLLQVLKNNKHQKILVGKKNTNPAAPPPDFLLTEVQQSITGTTFSINQRGAFTIPLLGEHNAMNALMAIAVARRLGLSDEQILAGLAQVRAPDMRFQPVPPALSGPFFIINDAYNANPSSMQAALKTFAKLTPIPGAMPHAAGAMPCGAGAPPGMLNVSASNPLHRHLPRKVVILADMLELGPSSPDLHRSIGQLVAELHFDLFIAIGSHMALAADAAAGIPVHRFPSTLSAKTAFRELLQPGDHILLKGSRSMALESLLDPLRQFPALASTPA